MKFRIISSIACLLLATATIAQTANVEYSVGFAEPERGTNRILQLKSGNTFHFYFNKQALRLTVFGKDRKIIGKKPITSKSILAREMPEASIEGIYEIAGKPVIFYHASSMVRLILDDNTGDIISEETMPGSYVAKDPASDAYIVISKKEGNKENEDGDKTSTVSVYHYNVIDGQHKEINTASIEVVGTNNVTGSVVDGDKRAFISLCGDQGKRKDRVSDIYIGCATVGEKTVTIKTIEPGNLFSYPSIAMQYNSNTGNVYMLAYGYTQKKGRQFFSGIKADKAGMLAMIDGKSLATIYAKPVAADKVNDYAKGKLNLDAFEVAPHHILLNKDNSVTLLIEDMSTHSYSSSIPGSSMQHTTTKTGYRSIGILNVDESGNEKDAMAFAKDQMSYDEAEPLFLYQRQNGPWNMHVAASKLDFINKPFLSFDYVNTGKNQYVFYNDYPENYERKPSKLKTVVQVSETNTICYKISNGNAEKSYLFGTPKNDDQSVFSFMQSAHFLPETNTYATLIVVRDGREKKAKLAWVKLD